MILSKLNNPSQKLSMKKIHYILCYLEKTSDWLTNLKVNNATQDFPQTEEILIVRIVKSLNVMLQICTDRSQGYILWRQWTCWGWARMILQSSEILSWKLSLCCFQLAWGLFTSPSMNCSYFSKEEAPESLAYPYEF